MGRGTLYRSRLHERARARGSAAAISLATCAIAGALASRADAGGPREALDQPWTVASLAEEKGLRRRVVYDVTFEPDGAAWIGASDGLYRYDGYSWKVFTADHGLPSPHVRAVLWTRKGELWVGTMKGAGVFDGTRFDDRGSVAGYGARSIKKMAEDPDGTIWMWSDQFPLGTQPGGIASYRDGHWRAYHVADGLPVEKVRNYFRDSRGRQFVMTGAGVSQRVGARWESLPLPAGAKVPWSMAEDESGVVAFGMGDGVHRLTDTGFTFDRRPVPLVTVNMVLRTRDNTLLVNGELGTQLVLYAWDGKDLVRASPVLSRQAPWVQAMRESPDGSVWVVGDFGLLVRWQRRGSEWVGYDNLPAPAYLDGVGRPVFHGNFDHVLWKPVTGTYVFDQDRFDGLAGSAPPETIDTAGHSWTLANDRVRVVDPRNGALVKELQIGELGFVRATSLLLDGRRTPWLVGVDHSARLVARPFGGVGAATEPIALPYPERTARLVRALPGDGIAIVATGPRGDVELLVVTRHRVERHPIAAKYDGNGHVHALDCAVDRDNVAWVFGWDEQTFLFGVPIGRDGEPGIAAPHRNERITSAIAVQGAIWFTKEPLQGGTDGMLVRRGDQWENVETPLWGTATRGFADRLLFRDRDRLVLVDSPDRGHRQLSMLPGREPPGSRLGMQPLWDRDGHIWTVATDTPRGDSRVMRFTPDRVPPDTLVDAPSEVRTDGSWKPHATGIERFVPMKQQRSFRFSYRFDGGAWSRFDALPANGFLAGAFEIGAHVFEVRAEDEGGDVDPSPAHTSFRVTSIPIEQRGWFKPTVATLFAAMLALALVAVERARKAFRANTSLRREMENRRAAEDAKTRIKNEIEIAERIQTTLLPRAPAARGLDVACKMLPASEVGGDYYDLLATADGAWVGIGDVAGHGLPAGLIMLMVQSALASVVAANPGIGPRDALVAVNAVLCENIRRRMRRDEHVTLSLLRYHTSGAVEFAGAHEEIVIWRAHTRRCELVPTPGAWTGVSLKAAAGYEENRLELSVGDVVVLYTDGVIEAKNAAGEEFGVGRLCRGVEAVADRDAGAMLDHLVALVRAWASVQDDDATVLVLRHVGAHTQGRAA